MPWRDQKAEENPAEHNQGRAARGIGLTGEPSRGRSAFQGVASTTRARDEDGTRPETRHKRAKRENKGERKRQKEPSQT